MKVALLFACLVVTCAAQAQEFLDRVGESLSFSVINDDVRARVSGTLDLESYHYQQPPPGLINSRDSFLFTPRLTLFLDAQAGSSVYFFAQARLDQGFDPTDRGLEIRLDEYAMRISLFQNGLAAIQVGKFATVVGNFVPRHLSWDNPFINAPLVYENPTALEDQTGHIVRNFGRALRFEKYELIPVIWGPSYATGISLSGRVGPVEYAAEIKNRSLSSRPETWDATRVGFDDPTYSGRIAYKPGPMWNFGFSVSDGAYLLPEAARALPRGTDPGDFREQLLGQDISFAWHHVQLWAEVYEARFDLPDNGEAGTVGWYLEGKYKVTPQFFAALRWNQQFFGSADQSGSATALGPDMYRIDAAATYRFTEHTQLKLQYSYQHQTRSGHEDNHLLAAQFTVRF
jgi:hypothetical protein